MLNQIDRYPVLIIRSWMRRRIIDLQMNQRGWRSRKAHRKSVVDNFPFTHFFRYWWSWGQMR